jgi:hypothetical protein
MAVHSEIIIGDVGVLGIGGSKTREVINYANGELGTPLIGPTPSDRDDFMRWLARSTLGFYDADCDDVFIGFPGPTEQKATHTVVGPMVNTDFLKTDTFVLEAELEKADPYLGRKIDNGEVRALGGTDGSLAAGAAVHFCGIGEDRITGIIVGTGIGGDTVERVEGAAYRRSEEGQLMPVYRSLPGLREIGHIPLLASSVDVTYETRYSGPALQERFDISPEDAVAHNEMWRFAGRGLARLVGTVALFDRPNLVVMSSGVGAGAYEKYRPHMLDALHEAHTSRNTLLRVALDGLRLDAIPFPYADTSELYGAPVLMAAHALQRQAA